MLFKTNICLLRGVQGKNFSEKTLLIWDSDIRDAVFQIDNSEEIISANLDREL